MIINDDYHAEQVADVILQSESERNGGDGDAYYLSWPLANLATIDELRRMLNLA